MQHSDFALVADQATLAASFPAVKADAEKQIAALVNKTLAALNAQTLTPELALYAWMEFRAIQMMVKRFETRVQLGEAAGLRLQDTLDR